MLPPSRNALIEQAECSSYRLDELIPNGVAVPEATQPNGKRPYRRRDTESATQLQAVGNRVAQARQALGLSQAALARSLGTSPEQLSQVEKARTPGHKLREKFCARHGISLPWLLTGQGDMRAAAAPAHTEAPPPADPSLNSQPSTLNSPQPSPLNSPQLDELLLERLITLSTRARQLRADAWDRLSALDAELHELASEMTRHCRP